VTKCAAHRGYRELPRHRAMFRVKVGAHFGRVTDEDKAAGFEDPYGRPDCPVPPKVPYREKLRQAVRLLIGRD